MKSELRNRGVRAQRIPDQVGQECRKSRRQQSGAWGETHGFRRGKCQKRQDDARKQEEAKSGRDALPRQRHAKRRGHASHRHPVINGVRHRIGQTAVMPDVVDGEAVTVGEAASEIEIMQGIVQAGIVDECQQQEAQKQSSERNRQQLAMSGIHFRAGPLGRTCAMQAPILP